MQEEHGDAGRPLHSCPSPAHRGTHLQQSVGTTDRAGRHRQYQLPVRPPGMPTFYACLFVVDLKVFVITISHVYFVVLQQFCQDFRKACTCM